MKAIRIIPLAMLAALGVACGQTSQNAAGQIDATTTTTAAAPTTTVTAPPLTTRALTKGEWMNTYKKAMDLFGDDFSGLSHSSSGYTPALIETACNLYVRGYDLIGLVPAAPDVRMDAAWQKMVTIATPFYAQCKSNPRVVPLGVPDGWSKYVSQFSELVAAYTAP